MKTLIIFLIAFCSLTAQTVVVEKVTGNVEALIGTSETWVKVKAGQTLNGTDLISTGKNSSVRLNSGGNKFILQSSSALGINSIKKISIKELLLALAMEEIRNVPDTKGNSTSRNTAVYGGKVNKVENELLKSSELGIKKLNGAKQLSKNGYVESAIVVAKETYRKYPETKNLIGERIYFADLMLKLSLYNEAASELGELKQMSLSKKEADEVELRFEKINQELANQ